jgi:magnesium chelatase family protein
MPHFIRILNICGHYFFGKRPLTALPISDIGLLSGSANPTPGEFSIAHNGVLLLDELPEFKRSALEVVSLF